MMLQVDTGEVSAVAGRLEDVARELDQQARLLAGVNWWPLEAATHISMPDVTAGAASACLLSPGLAVHSLQLSATAANLRTAVTLYVAADAAVEVALTSARTTATWLAGKVLAFLLLTPVGAGLTVTFVAWTAAGISIAQGLAILWWGANGKHAPNLTEAFLDEVNWQPLIRAGIDLAGQLPHGGLPPVVLPFIDQRGAQGTAAVAYLVALQLGLLRPGVFTVTQHATSYSRGARGTPTIGSLVGGIPPAATGQPQVTVTTHANADGDRIYEIAIAGTSSTAFGTDGQPFDSQGNAGTYADINAESVAAALAAIEAAGVPAGATVVLAGYSQGAMVAHAIAASAKYNVEFVTTIGTPSRPTGIPDDVTVVEIEHAADPVVGLQGTRPGDNDGAIVVTTDPALDDASAHHQGAMGNHAQDAYAGSADALAQSDDPSVQAAQAELLELFGGYDVTSVQQITVGRQDASEPLPGSVPWAIDGVRDGAQAVGAAAHEGAQAATEAAANVVAATEQVAHEAATVAGEVVDETVEVASQAVETAGGAADELGSAALELLDQAAETVDGAPVTIGLS